MGYLLSSYKKAVFDEIVNSISTNTSQYYAFVSNPKETSETQPVTTDIYSSMFDFSWNMIFGKKITANDVMPVIKKNIWAANTVYDRYDNNSETMFENNNFYAITEPLTVGGSYHVYLCIDNNNGAPSTVSPNSSEIPSQQFSQVYNFKTEDDYVWRYITSITYEIYNKFATNDYVPIYPNNNVVATASSSSGVDNVLVANGGAGYVTYHEDIIQYANSSIIRISNTAVSTNNFYNNCAIYIYNTDYTSQLKNISQYVSNNTGNWVITDTSLDISLISPGSTRYSISPSVVFETDAEVAPKAFATINASTNSISSVIVYQSGANLSWANAYVRSISGAGAVLNTVIAPPGGHGKNPAVELNMKGYCVSFKFSNTENGTILSSNTVYNKIGLLKNPHAINFDTAQKEGRYSGNTFSSVLECSVNHTFNKGEYVIGSVSKAIGTVAFANSTNVFLVGDKHFANGEFVSNTTTSNVTAINITSRGDVYIKDLVPLYAQNINNVNRETNQTESFKLIIKL